MTYKVSNGTLSLYSLLIAHKDFSLGSSYFLFSAFGLRLISNLQINEYCNKLN